MPTKENQDATMWAGRDYTLNFTETDGQNLNNFQNVTYAFAANEVASAEFTKNETNGITFAGASSEIAQVAIDGSDTSGLTAPKEYYHELVTNDSSGNEQQAAEGVVDLLPTVFDG